MYHDRGSKSVSLYLAIIYTLIPVALAEAMHGSFFVFQDLRSCNQQV
jgi:hypothetical protein